MFVKPIEIPVKLLQLEALSKRLVRPHPIEELIDTDLRKYMSGFRGEKSLEYHLRLLPDMNQYIFHNLRLVTPKLGVTFQMDILLLTPYFFAIFEVKNLSGSIRYDPEFQQLTQYYKEQQINYDDPLLQVQRQKYQLLLWLKDKNVENLPEIYNYVVISNPRTFIESTSRISRINSKIIRPEKISDYLFMHLNQHRNKIIDDKKLEKLSIQLKKSYVEEEHNALGKYRIEKNSIQTGVFCSKCTNKIMIRRRYDWYCVTCKEKSTDAHLQALKEFALLFGPTITTKQIQNFLHIESRYAARNLAVRLNLEKKKKSNKMEYILPF